LTVYLAIISTTSRVGRVALGSKALAIYLTIISATSRIDRVALRVNISRVDGFTLRVV